MCSPPVDQQQRSKDHNTNSERRADGTYREAANAGQTAPQARCNLQTTGPHTGQNEDEVRKTGEEGGRCCIAQKPGQVPARATDGQQMYWTGAFSAILRRLVGSLGGLPRKLVRPSKRRNNLSCHGSLPADIVSVLDTLVSYRT